MFQFSFHEHLQLQHNQKQQEHQEARHPKLTVLECFPDLVEIAPVACPVASSALEPSAAAAKASAPVPKYTQQNKVTYMTHDMPCVFLL